MSDNPAISVVVPTKNSSRTIQACLESLRQQDDTGFEVIVVDNYSDDPTPAIAKPMANTFVQHGPERSAQRNEGARIATGEIVVFIDSDMVVAKDLVRDIKRVFADGSVTAAVIPEYAFGNGFWAACRALEKRLYLGDSSVEAARVFRRESFLQAGGYDPELAAGEDWDLPDRMEASGKRVARVEARVLHDEGNLTLRETFRKKKYYGTFMRSYMRKGGRTASRRLTRLALFNKPGAILRDPIHWVGLLALKFTEAAGMATGMRKAAR